MAAVSAQLASSGPTYTTLDPTTRWFDAVNLPKDQIDEKNKAYIGPEPWKR